MAFNREYVRNKNYTDQALITKYYYNNRLSKSCWSKVEAINKSWKCLIRLPFSSASNLKKLF